MSKSLYHARQRTFAKLRWHPLLNGASRLTAMFGGPLLGAGLLGLVGFGARPGPAPVMMTVVGAVLSVLSIIADYIGARIGQDGSLDQIEIAAESTARHLLKALRRKRRAMR